MKGYVHLKVDAEEMWCPFARRWSKGGSYNRERHDTPAAHCLTDKCMLWVDCSHNSEARGYCAIAGRSS